MTHHMRSGTPKRSGADAYGWTYEHLQVVVGDQDATSAVCPRHLSNVANKPVISSSLGSAGSAAALDSRNTSALPNKETAALLSRSCIAVVFSNHPAILFYGERLPVNDQ